MREHDVFTPSGFVLNSKNSSTLLLNTGSATLAGSLYLRFRRRSTEHASGLTLFLVRRASIWSVRTLVRVFSALALWMYSMRTRLFLKTLPLDFWYSWWYLERRYWQEHLCQRKWITHKCLTILPASLYFRNSRRRTRCLRIHWTLVGIRASAVPFLLPVPV